jgi:hypothetical protein
MKYRLEIMTRDKNFNIMENIEKEFDTPEEAHEERYRILDNIKPGLHVSWNKVFPIIICSCGEQIACTGFTNTCDNCDADYNMAGQRLAPRSQWGEETGESWQECY